MFDIWLMLGFGVAGYVFKKISMLAPFTPALVLGNRAEDAFRLSMIGSGGDMKVFWSNGLVGSITTLAIVLWPLIDKARQRRAIVAAGKGCRLGNLADCGKGLADLSSQDFRNISN
jgi:TctA family transporter